MQVGRKGEERERRSLSFHVQILIGCAAGLAALSVYLVCAIVHLHDRMHRRKK